MLMLKEAIIYWIRLPEHTDIATQGYVGVSKNPKSRWSQHLNAIQKKLHHNQHLTSAVSKYGWDNLVKETILQGDEEYCYTIENQYRPAKNIGWNIAAGGGRPPSSYTKAEYAEYLNSEEYKEWEWCYEQGIKKEAELKADREEQIKLYGYVKYGN
jgi:hypothetical protein